MNSEVALISCGTYELGALENAMERLFDEVPPPDVKGKTVLLKPNILSPKKAEAAVCTHPSVVATAIKAFLKRGAARVLVGESPAVSAPLQAAKACGIYDACISSGGEWVSFENPIEVACPEGTLVKVLHFASVFAEVDVLVTMPKLKTHQLMGYTGAMKNLFGLMVGLQKAQTHYRFSAPADFARFLTDLNIAAKPQYGIMDAIIGMDGPGGPGNGDPVDIAVLAASQNVLALDWVCASLVGFNASGILNLADALERGVWLKTADDIVLKGDDFESLKPKHFQVIQNMRTMNLLRKKPIFIQKCAEFFFTLWPYFNRYRCTQCGKCIEICPAQILSFSKQKDKKHVIIDKKHCLRCYCCHEVCPSKAIDLKRNW